jgi:hypothetical protein
MLSNAPRTSNFQKKFIVVLLISLTNGVAGSSDDSTMITSSGILGVWALSSALKDRFLQTSCVFNSAFSNSSWDLLLLLGFLAGFRYSHKDAPDIRHTVRPKG